MKIAVITGASSGMGWECAIRLWEQFPGLDEIWAVGRRKERLVKLEEKVNIPVRKFVLDLSQEKEREILKAELERLKPQVKFLVNAAGFGKRPVRNGAGKLYCSDSCYHHGPSFYASEQPHPAVCFQCSLSAPAGLCSICSFKGLCVKLQPGIKQGIKGQKDICNCHLPGTGAHRIF